MLYRCKYALQCVSLAALALALSTWLVRAFCPCLTLIKLNKVHDV
jgi:hypothetical protein